MARGRRDGLLIAGGGLAGCLVALAMAKLRPEVPILLVEEAESFGAGRSWPFFEADVPADQRWLIEKLIAASWPGFYVLFPGQSRNLKSAMHLITGEALDRTVRETLRPEQYRLGTKVVAARDDELVLLGGEKVKAEGAIDARGPANLSMLRLGWRKFVRRHYRFEAPHKLDRPVLIDATVEQWDGCRFAFCLPLSEDRMLIEDVHYAAGPVLDTEAAAARINGYVAKRGWRPAEIEGQSEGATAVPYGGDFDAFWRVGGARVAKLGLRGGFFHPLTGHSVPDAVRTAMLVAGQSGWSGAELHDLVEAEATRGWKAREFYRSVSERLFSAGPEGCRAALERLYALDPAIIARFHGMRTGMLDRMRIQAALKS
jgi:lycopene beta-cyclase